MQIHIHTNIYRLKCLNLLKYLSIIVTFPKAINYCLLVVKAVLFNLHVFALVTDPKCSFGTRVLPMDPLCRIKNDVFVVAVHDVRVFRTAKITNRMYLMYRTSKCYYCSLYNEIGENLLNE
jgi:hypothetical protein